MPRRIARRTPVHVKIERMLMVAFFGAVIRAAWIIMTTPQVTP